MEVTLFSFRAVSYVSISFHCILCGLLTPLSIALFPLCTAVYRQVAEDASCVPYLQAIHPFRVANAKGAGVPLRGRDCATVGHWVDQPVT